MKIKDIKKYLKFAEMCKASWYRDSSISFLNKNGITGHLLNFSKTDVEGFWYEDLDAFYIVFRATELDNIKEITENFYFTKKKVGKIMFHAGVVDKVNSDVIKEIKKIVKHASDINKPVYLVGHSLGGSISQLVAYYMYLYNLNIEKVITFGTYSSGNGKFNKIMKDKMINIIAKWDFTRCYDWFLKIFFNFRSNHTILQHEGFIHFKYHFIQFYIDLLKRMIL